MMENYLIIPFLAFLLSFPISYRMWREKFAGQNNSKAYAGKYVWGFRYFLFPTISLFLLSKYDLTVFCFSLLFCGVLNSLLRVIFSEDRKPHLLGKFGYLSYVFIAFTLYLNDPFWLQIWPSLNWFMMLLIALAAGVLGKTTQLTNRIFDVERSSETQIKILNWTTPALSLTLLALNEWFRTQTSFEAWAFFNAFQIPVFVLIVFLGTIIIVPIVFRD